MEMPNNKATSVTEKIMAWVRAKTDQHDHTKIKGSAQYNRIYEGVYETLASEFPEWTKG